MKYSQRMADSVMAREAQLKINWAYDYELVFKGLYKIYQNTGEKKYFNYIKENIDRCLSDDGDIICYKNLNNIDHLNLGKSLLVLYKETKDEKYKKAASVLRQQLFNHPRTKEGGFWHKEIYPHQMWLDGLYMGAPFYLEYTLLFEDNNYLDDVKKQFSLMYKNALDEKTGLLFHAWDESKLQKWSNKLTGCSPNFWGRAMGWFLMALVDVLDYIPNDDKDRIIFYNMIENIINALKIVQDDKTGLWYQVLNKGELAGNYLEASCSSMFCYAIAKAVNNGYVSSDYMDIAKKAYKGIVENLIEVDEKNLMNLTMVCEVAGLGGDPYRDGSYEYYVKESIKTNDFKGVGPFILASLELDL